jgi:hypothetical protein
LSHAFYIGKYPVTQAQYQAVLNENPSKSTRHPSCPVDMIGEDDCQRFCDKLTETAGRDIRLPTEAEWEYACRAGTSSKWFFGDDPSELDVYAWYEKNSGGKSHPVGLKKPNPWGLYDMYGQVLERCSDKYHKDYFTTIEAQVDPTGPSAGITSLMEFKISIPSPGRYKLSGKVVTMNQSQRLMVAVNNIWANRPKDDSVAPVDDSCDVVAVNLPFTLGLWREFGCDDIEESSDGDGPVVLDLQDGPNTLWVWRDAKSPQYGIAVQEFVLMPLW